MFKIHCKKVFWFENVSELFCKLQIPRKHMTLEEQMNSITQIVLILFLCILILTNLKISFLFLIISLILIIILYYIQKRAMNKFEYYENTDKKASFDALTDQYLSFKNLSNRLPATCNTGYTEVVAGPTYFSFNQQLVGNKANPKTYIPPVVVPPSHALEYWAENNLINSSKINVESQHDTYLSGYTVSYKPKENKENKENYMFDSSYHYEGISNVNYTPLPPNSKNPIISPIPENIKNSLPVINHDGRTTIPNNCNDNNTLIENYTNIPDSYFVRENQPGWVDTSNGYNPEQLFDYDLPTNFPVGNCNLSPEMKQYNKNLFTQNIQPDSYTRNEIIEPINSNIGISFTQQFEPLTSTKYGKDNNQLSYIEHDPRLYQPQNAKKIEPAVTESNIYDPRFSGYGSYNRAYPDKNLGQTKFFYDDINSVRMPNYLSRSNIDFAKYADSYGPLTDKNRYGNENTANIRELAQKSFLDSSIEQRESLSESLMRKRNSEMWQVRQYPKRTY